MTQKKNHFLICLMVVLISLVTRPYIVVGASTNGQVVVPSEISFYEERDETATHSSSNNTQANSKHNTTVKQTGYKKILPQTGEVIKNYGFIGILILILISSLFFLRKSRKDDTYEA